MNNNKWTADSWLYHHSIKGQKWGIRRFQDSDGRLTSLGQARYRTGGMSADEYACAYDLWRNHKQLNLPGRIKEDAYEELDNILSAEEKELSVVSRAIDNYRYTAIHKGHLLY